MDMSLLPIAPLSIVTYQNSRDNVPKPKTLAWDEMIAGLARHTPRATKDGPAWSPASFPEGKTRANGNALAVSCFVVDVDDGAPPEALWGRWQTPSGQDLAWCLHSSYSSTAEQPKWRVVFPLAAPVPATDWPAAHRKLTLALAEGHADPSCKDAARLYYRPSCPPEALGNAFTFVREGAPLDLADFPDPPPAEAAEGQMRYAFRSGPPPAKGEGSALDGRPGDDYSAHADVPALLERHGWQSIRDKGGLVLLRRPGKAHDYSGTFGYAGTRMFYCFTSSAPPFEAQTGYSPFGVYAALEHGGDYAAAARRLRTEGYGEEARNAAIIQRGQRAEAAAKGDRQNPEAQKEPSTRGPATQDFALTDIGNGQRLAARHGADLRFCHAWEKWLIWDGQCWQKDDTGEIDRRAKETAQHIYQEAADCPDTARQTELAKHALRSQSHARVQSMIALANSEPGVPARAAEWDKRPWLLACDNGTIDLKTGRLHESGRGDMGTKRAGTHYDPEAIAPRWETFLETVLPDAGTRAFFQRAAGYTLTGDVSEQCLFFLYGSGSNGKSTALRALMDTLGNYALQAAPDLLIAREGAQGGPNNDVAELQGTRLVATIEVEDGKRMAEGLVKQITGGDRIKARFMRQDFFEFEPTHKIFLAANHKPAIRGQDVAIWRRIRMVPFDVQIADADKDPHLADKLRAEMPGILAWAVRGCLDWQRQGLAAPAAVLEATAAYQAGEDVLGDFLGECCLLRPALRVTAAALYTAYVKWAEENSERGLSKKNFGARLQEGRRIFPASSIGPKKARGWEGIGLLDTLSAAIYDDVEGTKADKTDKSGPQIPISADSIEPREDNLEITSHLSVLSEVADEDEELIL